MTPVSDQHWRGRRVLVTGATGFIGAATASRLLREGAIVSGTSRRDTGSREGISMHCCDLADLASVRALIEREKPDAIIHTAGHPFAARDLARVEPTFRDNLETVVNLLIATSETRTPRVVLCGSLEEPEADDAAGALSSPYAISKWAATNYARLFHALYQHPVVIARLFMVYGPGQNDLKKLIPGSILALLRKESPAISSGERPVDWVYIDDVVSGLLACASAPGSDGKRIDIGTGVLTTVRGIVETLARLIPGSPAPRFGSAPSRAAEQVRAARIEETRAALSWAPSIDIHTGLQRTIDWYRTHAAT